MKMFIQKWLDENNFYKGYALAFVIYVVSFVVLLGVKWFVMNVLTIDSFNFTMLKISLASVIIPVILWRRAVNRGLDKQARAIILVCFLLIIISFLTLNQ